MTNDEVNEMMTDWKPISTAGSLDRLIVAGWQKPSGTTAGYWWYYEDMTDEHGNPIDYPEALMWHPFPSVAHLLPPQAATP